MLSFTLSRGADISKDNISVATHPSYECIFRVLKENPQSLIDFSDDGLEHSIAYAFANYRELHIQLNDIGVTSKKPFPETKAKSKLGIGLTESELQQRCQLLSAWFEEILYNFSLIPYPAQAAIFLFLKLENKQDRRLRKASSNRFLIDDAHQIKDNVFNTRDKAIDIISEMLSKPGSLYRPPDSNKKPSIPGRNKINDEGDNYDNKNNNNSNSDNGVPRRINSNENSNVDVKVGGKWKLLNNSLRATHTPEPHMDENASVVSETELIDVHLVGLGGSSFTTTIRDHLNISLERGLNIQKDSQSKKHVSYLTTISIQGSDMVYQSILKQTTFDEYRKLASDLQKVDVGDSDSSRFITTKFPVTYRKSSLGMALARNEIEDRILTLGKWVARVIELYPVIPVDGQNSIADFFDLNKSNSSSDPQTKAILQILHSDWTSNDSKVRETCRNQILLKPSKEENVKNSQSRKYDPDFKEIGDDGSAPPTGCGVSCAIM